jgi:hypothetical protein
MKNALFLAALACALTFGGAGAQEASTKETGVPVDASGKEAVTRTKSKPVTAGKQVAPATAPENEEPLRDVPAARPAAVRPERRDSTAPAPSAPSAPATPSTMPGRPMQGPPPVRK